MCLLITFLKYITCDISDCKINKAGVKELYRKKRNYTLKSFETMSKRGLYSYDVDTGWEAPIDYHLMTYPTQPLHISNVPVLIKEVLEKNVLQDIEFREKYIIEPESFGNHIQ